MKVKICSKCPYVPTDIAENYDPDAETFLCHRCPEQGMLHTGAGPYYREWVRHYGRTLYAKLRREHGHASLR